MNTSNTTVYAQWKKNPKTITLTGNLSAYEIDCSGYSSITVYIYTNTSDHTGTYYCMGNISPTNNHDDQIGYYWSAAAYDGSCTANISGYSRVYVWSSLGSNGFSGIPDITTKIILQ